jgi:hypothetical protein
MSTKPEHDPDFYRRSDAGPWIYTSGCYRLISPARHARAGSRVTRKAHIAVSAEICTQHILLQHSLGVEEGTIQANGVAHDFEEATIVTVEQGDDHTLQLIVE